MSDGWSFFLSSFPFIFVVEAFKREVHLPRVRLFAAFRMISPFVVSRKSYCSESVKAHVADDSIADDSIADDSIADDSFAVN